MEEDVPLLDFSRFLLSNDDAQRLDLARALVGSLKHHGFAKLMGHGIAPKAVADAFESSRNFFALSEGEKRKAAHPDGPNPHRGYCHVGLERTYGVTGFERGLRDAPQVLDIKESFDIGDRQDPLFANRWPEDKAFPGFRQAMEGFFDQCHHSLCQIMDAVAIGLGLEPRSLALQHSDKNHELRLLHYPAVDAALLDGSRLRIAEHTDFGSLTLLFQDEVGGLEVEAQHFARVNGPETASALPFRVIRDSAPVMIVNIGDSLERWTNSQLRAVVHRVSKTPCTQGTSAPSTILPDRYSVAFFGKPNRDASLYPLAPFVTNERKAVWGDTSAHAYNQSKLIRTFAA